MGAAKKTLLSILDKLGVEYTDQISEERAAAKVTRNVEKKGMPKELTKEEVAALEELGFTKKEKKEEKAPAKEEKAEPKKTKPAKEKEEKKSKEEAPANKTPKAPRKSRGEGATATFKKFWAENSKATRKQVIAAMVKGGGIKDYCVPNYIAMAKKNKSAFGFLLTETKAEDGTRHLHRK